MEKKKINKKVVLRNVLIILLIVLTISNLSGKKDKELKMIQKTKIASDSTEGEVHDLLIESGENQMVINLGNTCWMFYEFENDKIISLKYYYDYQVFSPLLYNIFRIFSSFLLKYYLYYLKNCLR